MKRHALVLALAIPSGFTFNAAEAVTITDAPTVADSMIYGSYRDSNYGGDVNLYTTDGTSASANAAGRALFKFDLTGVEDTVLDATLNLTTGTINSNSPSTFNFYLGTGVGSQNWIENQVQWTVYSTGNSWSTVGGDYNTGVSASAVVAGTVTPFTVDVTALAQAAIDAGQTYLTIFAFSDATNWGQDALSSKENQFEDRRPSLTVTSEAAAPPAVPEPASFALLAAGGMLVLGRRRR